MPSRPLSSARPTYGAMNSAEAASLREQHLRGVVDRGDEDGTPFARQFARDLQALGGGAQLDDDVVAELREAQCGTSQVIDRRPGGLCEEPSGRMVARPFHEVVHVVTGEARSVQDRGVWS